MTRWNGGLVCGSAIVQQSFHVLDGGGERERSNGGAVAIEGHPVVAPRSAILKDEDLPPPFVAKVQKLVAGAAQEPGEVEVARLKCHRVADFGRIDLSN